MGKKRPRHGTLQFWPRKRIRRAFPRTNWSALESTKSGLMGFIGYKVGMKSAYAKDNTPDSMTKNKRIIVPVTLIECPPMRILSARFYKNGIVAREVMNYPLDKELKRKIKIPKEFKTKEALEKAEKEDYDDLRVVVYSQVFKTSIKKRPDVIEVALGGSKEDKLKFIKENLNKEILINDVFERGIVDIRGITKGKGFQGPVKRFGIRLRFHKSEKGIRKVGSIGPWHPARIPFKIPFAGQVGLFSRINYNVPIVGIKSANDVNTPEGFNNYGMVKNNCLIVRGSVQGPSKRQVLITSTLRARKRHLKKQYELITLR